MEAMAKMQHAGAAANIEPDNRTQKTRALNRPRKSAQDWCAQKWSSFYSWTIGTEIWIKNVNVSDMSVASEESFVTYLENPRHFFWPGENRSV